MSSLKSNKLFLKDSAGRFVCRRREVWCSVAESCLDCGRNDVPHEAKGRCRLCYIKFRRRTDPEYKAKENARQKARMLRSDYQEKYDQERRARPERIAQRREISARYARKHAKWPPGALVEYELIAGHFIQGRITDDRNRASCVVQFKTMAERIPYLRLRRVDERLREAC